MNLIWLTLQLFNCLTIDSLTALNDVCLALMNSESTVCYNCYAALIEVTMSYSSSVLLFRPLP
jgi:hypothetical protein